VLTRQRVPRLTCIRNGRSVTYNYEARCYVILCPLRKSIIAMASTDFVAHLAREWNVAVREVQMTEAGVEEARDSDDCDSHLAEVVGDVQVAGAVAHDVQVVKDVDRPPERNSEVGVEEGKQ
jgi:hypothetical protein